MIYRFTEVLNDLVNYFILGDILLLENWKRANNLSDDNGWYHIEILGGETLQDGDYEPTFEFLIQPAANEEATINADMNCSFEITSSAY